MGYTEKLRSPKWQKKRLIVLSRDNFKCVYCGDGESTLHVHHEDYIGENPWDTPDYLLNTVCEECHSVSHLPFTNLEKNLFQSLRYRHTGDSEQIKLLNSVVKNSKKNG